MPWSRRMGWLVALLAALWAADRLLPVDTGADLEYAIQVRDADGRLLRVFTTTDGYWRLPLNLDALDPLFVSRLLAYEDARFYRHPGVDPLALVRALGQLLRHGEVVSGASTLSMQTVRLLDPGPRTLSRKLLEMWRALQLEWRLSKREILRLYLTLAPYGGNIQGLRAASLLYFGKEPRRLTVAESALLIALPQRPEARRPDRHPEAAARARSRVLVRLRDKGHVSAQQVALARTQALPRRRAWPFLAPHLARRLRHADPACWRHHLFIDSGLQTRLQRLAERQQQRLDAGETLALLVVRKQGRQVVGHLGSGDYFGRAHAGMLDHTRRLRSPGSTLKPFIYGLGFEQGFIHPETRVADRPYRSGTYRPGNFDGRYRGSVSVARALRQSLNVPAVKILERVGPGRLAGRLRQTGVSLRFPPQGKPGLPLALGGVGMTLEDLVALYAALADRGRFLPLRYSSAVVDTAGPYRLLSETAAWYVTSILRRTPAPAGMLRSDARLAYKTGTSYGFRDAWAIGYNDDYVVGVWVGRSDGGYGKGRSGLDLAAPLLFDVFDMLPQSPAHRLAAIPPGVLRVSHAELPATLQSFDYSVTRGGGPAARPEPRIVFPPDGATLPAERAGNTPQREVVLRAEGGEPPFLWLVNGVPLGGVVDRARLSWLPDGPGQHRITLSDASGRTCSVTIWLEAAAGERTGR